MRNRSHDTITPTEAVKHYCQFSNLIFPAIKLRPQTPPIDKREIGDAAIPGEFPLSPPPLWSLANERAVSSDVKQ